MFSLDHIAVAGESLADAVAHVEESLGVRMQPGGQHPRFGTHNRLLGLADGLYLEAIAIEPGASVEESPRWFDLDRFSGAARLSNWILRSEDLEADRCALPKGAQRAVAMQRGDLRWLMTVPDDGVLPFDNMFPAVLQWLGAPPAGKLAVSGCRLQRLVVSHPEAGELRRALAKRFFDDRVVIETGLPGYRAEILTPSGLRVLS